MIQKQKTIKHEVNFSGISLHTGNQTNITFKPALPDTGIVFVRTDLQSQPHLKASVENIANVIRGTNISSGNVQIFTVEHLLATLAGNEIDNMFIELDSSEPPVGDGSAKIFLDMIERAEIQEQDEVKHYCTIKQPISVEKNGSFIIVLPSDELRISCTISFGHPEIGSQFLSLIIDKKSFRYEISQARTFCFYHEVEGLMDKGLIKGGSLDNAVVIGDDSVFCKENLRFPDEFVRHKILDILGDICLIGKPLKGHIIAVKPGHAINIDLAQRIFTDVIKTAEKRRAEVDQISSYVLGDAVIDVNQIMNILPHRYPFLLVDRIIELHDTRAVGIKNVTINEQFFNGHFPGRPIMPGVLICEAMAQVGGIMLLKKSENLGKLAYFMSMNNVKFRKIVVPGDQLRFVVVLGKVRSKTGQVRGEAFVGGDKVAEADLMFSLVD